MKYLLVFFITFNIISCSSLNTGSSKNDSNRETYLNSQGLHTYYEVISPRWRVIYLEDSYRHDPSVFTFPFAPEILRYKSSKPSIESFTIASKCMVDIDESILFNWKGEFNEIAYKNTRDKVSLLDLWVRIERDYLLKTYSNQIIREYHIWSKILREPYEEYDDEYYRNLLHRRFNEAFGVFYPLLNAEDMQNFIQSIPHYSQKANYHWPTIRDIYMPIIDTDEFVFRY